MKNAMNLSDFATLVVDVASTLNGFINPQKDHDYAWPRCEMVVDGVTFIVSNQYPYDRIEFSVKTPTMPKYFNLTAPSCGSAITTNAKRMASNVRGILTQAQEYLAALNVRLAVEASEKAARETTKTLSAALGVRFSEYNDNGGSGIVNGHYVSASLRENGGVSRLQVDGLTDEQYQKVLELLGKI